jgi:hypothetical protein
MDVRCRGCQAEVSEWAALCPVCRRSLDDAEPLPVPDPPPPPPAPQLESPRPVSERPVSERAGAEDPWDEEDGRVDAPWGGAISTRGRQVVLSAVAAVAIIGLVVGLVVSGRGHHVAPSSAPTTPPVSATTPATTLPAALADERLFFADPGRTGLYQSDGVDLGNVKVEGTGYPLEPLVSSLGIVVFIHDEDAFRTSVDASAPAVELGGASWIFPGRNGTIGVQSKAPGGRSIVRYMAADGAYSRRGPATVLPAGDTAIAQVPLGLVVAHGANLALAFNQLAHLQISLLMPAKRAAGGDGFTAVPPADELSSTESLGEGTAIIGVHRATVAWIRCPRDLSVDCSLHIVNTTTLSTQVVRYPADSSGFAQGGGFSPNGTLLATFVRTGVPDGASLVHAEVYDLASGLLTPIGPGLLAAELTGSGTWSADGRYLYFGGLLGSLYAEPTIAIGTSRAPWKLPIATSYSVVGY